MSDRAPDRLLYALKAGGPQTAAALADRLGVTSVAVRQHLAKLGSERLVAYEDRRETVGRPKRYWSLTAKGHARFPDAHSGLMVDIVDSVLRVFGEEGLVRLIEDRETRTVRRYRERIGAARTLGAKVQLLAELRSEEGYMAETRAEADDVFLLVENHCPICVAARCCQDLCRSELATFHEVLGEGVAVERVEHLLAGGRRCTYRIRARG